MVELSLQQLKDAFPIVAQTSLIAQFLFTFFVLMVIGYASTNNYRKFTLILILTFLLSLGFLLVLLFNPGIAIWLHSLFS